MRFNDSGGQLENTYDKIVWARNVLDLPESATMGEIKNNYRRLIHKWHPDKCKENQEICREMTNNIIRAYKLISAYCNQYKFSFCRQEVEKYLSAEEWWLKKFGANPHWGSEDSNNQREK